MASTSATPPPIATSTTGKLRGAGGGRPMSSAEEGDGRAGAGARRTGIEGDTPGGGDTGEGERSAASGATTPGTPDSRGCAPASGASGRDGLIGPGGGGDAPDAGSGDTEGGGENGEAPMGGGAIGPGAGAKGVAEIPEPKGDGEADAPVGGRPSFETMTVAGVGG